MLTSTDVQSHIDHSLSEKRIPVGVCNSTAIYTRCDIVSPTAQVNSLNSMNFIYVTRAISKVQSHFIRGVPISTVRTLSSTAACEEVSAALYTVTTIFSTPNSNEVHVAVVGQISTHEADVRNSLRVDLHQRREQAQQQWTRDAHHPTP